MFYTFYRYKLKLPRIINWANTKAQFDINPSSPGQNLAALIEGVLRVNV